MRAFKFIVPSDQFYALPNEPTVAFRGVVAVTIAESESDARANVERYCTENGHDARWLAVARVIPLPLEAGAVLAFAMV